MMLRSITLSNIGAVARLYRKTHVWYTEVVTVDVHETIEMEHIVNLHIEKLPEGVYLATSDEVSGLVAQGRTIAETIEIARDVAQKLSLPSATPPIAAGCSR